MTSEKTVIPTILDGENPLRVRFIPYNARLVETRKAKGWTQGEMSLMTGIQTSRISAIETLRREPTEDEKFELASALEASPEYLFPESLLGIIREGIIPQKRVAHFGDEHLSRLIESRKLLMLEKGKQLEKDMLHIVDISLLKEPIEEVLKKLSLREQQVLRLRFGLQDGRSRTLEEVGGEINFTPERIRQIEAKALRKLRHPSRRRKLKDYLE